MEQIFDSNARLIAALKRAIHELKLAKPGTRGQDAADIAGAIENAEHAIAKATKC